MEKITFERVSFQYPDMNDDVLENVSFDVTEGEFVILCGPSGCGKTTLLRLLKREIAPVGTCSGEIMYAGKRIKDWDERTAAEDIGFVFQDPENQIVMDEVQQEIVFGMENMGYTHAEMRKRMADMVHYFGMGDLLKEKTSDLSGGQKQLLNILSVLVLKPKVLLLDEPTSQLDPVAAKNVIGLLERLNKEMGMTIILVEHRLEELFALADQVLMLQAGKVAYKGTSRDVIEAVYAQQDDLFMQYIPSIARLYLAKAKDPTKENIPLTVKDSKAWMATFPQKDSEVRHPGTATSPERKPLLSVEKAYVQYERHGPMVLRNIYVSIHKGDYLALVGGNGSGKTTLLKLCLGILKAQRGTVKLDGKKIHTIRAQDLFERVAYVPQNPKNYFVQDTVEKEMVDVLARQQIKDGSEKIEDMLGFFELTHIRHRHPYDCSGGELQRAALACMILGNPDLLFIDEPTKGLDPVAKRKFASMLRELHEQGVTIVIGTHDVEFAAKNAHQTAMLFDGAITIKGTPADVFKGNYFYTTAINRATRITKRLESLTLEEALCRW